MKTNFGTFAGRAIIAKSLLGTVILLTGCEATVNSTLPTDSAGTSTLTPLSPSADATHILSGKKAYKDDGTVLTGTMSNLGALDVSQSFSGPGYVSSVTGLASTDICSSANFLGLAGTAVCAGAPSSLDASVSFVSGNYNAVTNAPAASSYLSTTTIFGTPGTMLTRTLSNASTTVNAGYYAATTLTAVDADLVSSNIKSGVTIFGVAGSSSVVDTASGDAVAGDMLSGKKGYVNGSLVTGTATNQGALNLNTTAIPGSSGGFYSSIALTLSASSVCVGTSIFGSAGTAVCNSVFGDLTASNMNRDPATAQMSLSTEKTTSSYAAGYREVPDALKDDDGYYNNTTAGCGGSGGPYDTCTQVVFAARPGSDCGTSGSITARIANCLSVNGAAATWNGSTEGTNGEATWKLVTRLNSKEVWRDERSGLVWSDTDGSSYNWCYAAGNAQSDDPSGYCNNASYQDQTTPYSVCAEPSGSQGALSGDDYVGGTYSDMKGGMGKLSTDAVRWRLPVRNDYLQAEIDGIRYVLPNMYQAFWSATVFSNSRDVAWYFDGYVGYISYGYRYSNYGVRCVGR